MKIGCFLPGEYMENKKTKKHNIILYIVFGTVFIVLFAISLYLFLPTFQPLDLTTSSPIYKEDRLYYNNLSRKNQFLYDALVEAVDSFSEYTEEIHYTYKPEDFNQVVEYITADHPEYFFVDYENIVPYVSETHTKVKLAYRTDKETILKQRKELNDKVKEIVSAIDDDMSDFEKELYIHDYLVENCVYLTEPKNATYVSNTAYGALCEGQAYCDGYALAFKMLINEIDMFCCVVEGSIDNLAHMWNIIKVDDTYFHVDVTWNDSDNDEMQYHGYMNLTEERMSETHKVTTSVKFPAATTVFDYYDALGLTAKDNESLRSILHESTLSAIDSQRNYIELKLGYDCSEDELNSTFHDVIALINAEGKQLIMDAFIPSYCAEDKNIINFKIFYEVTE